MNEPIKGFWTRHDQEAVIHLAIPVGIPTTLSSRNVLLCNQDGPLREIHLPITKVNAVLSISQAIGNSTTYLYLKRGDWEMVLPHVEKEEPTTQSLHRLKSIVDSLTDGYVSFSRSALEQIDAILSNI